MFENEIVNRFVDLTTKDNMDIVKDNFIEFIITSMKDIFTPLQVANNAKECLLSIPNRIYFSYMKRFLKKSYCMYDLETRVRFSKKFSDDGYKKYIKRQIELINSINDEDKIDYIANLTRAHIMGFIDNDVYFKLANIICQATSDELNYLATNIDKPIRSNNAYIFSLQQLGLVQERLVAGASANLPIYRYTEFAKAMDRFAISYNMNKYKYSTDIIINLNNMNFEHSNIENKELTSEEKKILDYQIEKLNS